jgi:histidyl-tRNA synthetase
MSEFKAVRGMRDFLSKDAEKTRLVEQTARELAGLYGYEEVITPVVESYELLTAKIGEEIRLRMYAFKDLGGRNVALRPEFTASIARLIATKLRTAPKPIRLFCVGSLYRYDEPQFGRFREFWQADYELMGSTKPEADAEIIMLMSNLLRRLGICNHYLKIGHMGILRGILSTQELNEDQQNRIIQLLDKKRWEEALALVRELNVSQQCLATLKNVFEIKGKKPTLIVERILHEVKNYEEAATAVEDLKEILDIVIQSNADLEILVQAGFARGLEYYTGMIAEVFVPELDFALIGGGRYDRLVELFGGESTPAVGFAAGIDSMILAMKKQKSKLTALKANRVMLVPVSSEMKPKVFEVSSMLRESGIPVEIEVMGRGVSKALSDADRRGFTYAVLIGPEEAKAEKVVLKYLEKREQETVEIKNLVNEIKVKTD